MDSHSTGHGFKTQPVRYTFYRASDGYHHKSIIQDERPLMCVEGWGMISRLGLTQDIRIGSCVFQWDVPHQWIPQRQVAPPPCLCILWWVGCHVLYLRHGKPVWQHILVKVPLLQVATAPMWPQMFKNNVKHKQTDKYRRVNNFIADSTQSIVIVLTPIDISFWTCVSCIWIISLNHLSKSNTFKCMQFSMDNQSWSIILCSQTW